MSCTFKQAVKWEIISKNPFELSDALPKIKYKKRDIWDAETISKALNECRDGKLYVAMNLSFACSIREGEILGLTWDLVHISDEDIVADNAYIDIKASQGDTGHAQTDMITEVYSHILDEDRKIARAEISFGTIINAIIY